MYKIFERNIVKILSYALFIFLFVTSSIVLDNATAYSGAYQKVTVNDLRLIARTYANVNESFFFHLYANLSMQEWVDLSGNQRPSIINGPFLRNSHNLIGLMFDGKDDVVILKNSRSLNPTNELTIEMWVQFSSYGGTALVERDWFTLLSKGDYWSIASYCLLFAANSTDRTILFVLNGSKVAYAKTFAKNHVWYHIVATFNGSFATIFLDGELVTSLPFNGILSHNDNDLYIGNEKGNIYPFNGLIRVLRIYNKSLSPNDVKIMHQKGSLNISESVVLDLNAGKCARYSFERSQDGLSFHEVFQGYIDQTFFLWKENQPGRYFYRISLLSIENNEILRHSNICIVNIRQQESKIYISKSLYGILLILASMVIFYIAGKREDD